MRGKASNSGMIAGEGAVISLALDEQTWSAIEAISAANGHLEFWRLIEKDSSGNILNIWQTEAFFPVNIPLGHMVQAEVDIVNDSSYDLAGTLTVEFLDPDGSSRGKRSFTYSAILLGTQRGVTTSYTTLDKGGTWAIHAKFEV